MTCDPNSEAPDSDNKENDNDDCDTELLTPDKRIFSGTKYDQTIKWMYYSVSKNGCCKTCKKFFSKQFYQWSVYNLHVLGTYPSRKLPVLEKISLEKFSQSEGIRRYVSQPEGFSGSLPKIAPKIPAVLQTSDTCN